MRFDCEVICQHTLDGAIMPIKLRFTGEDGEIKGYAVKRYREYEKGEGSMGNENVAATSTLRRFRCVIESPLHGEMTLELYYNLHSGKWHFIA